MTIDDRMQTAFKNRLHSLETTVTVQTPSTPPPSTPPPTTPTPSPQGNPGGFFGTFGPWMVGAAAAAAVIVGGAVLMNNDGEDTTIIAEQPTTSVMTDLEAETTLTTSPTVESTVTTGAGTETTEANKETSSTAVSPAATCSATGYSVTVPANWFHDGCATFSPAAIPGPGPFEFRPEIDLAYTTTETYGQALSRINSTMTVLSATTTTVDGLDATIFTIEEEWFEVGLRTVYAVDGGTGVFFASGNELVDSGATVTDLDAHYTDTLVALGDMMATADITYVAPKQSPACAAPTLSNPSTGPSIQADIDGDGQADTVDLVHHDNGVSIVVDAGAPGYFVGAFAFGDPAHVSNELVAVDLDGNGTSELLGSAASGAAGSNYEAFRLSGCDLVPIGGATPALIQRASAANVATFECSFGAHGKVELDTMSSVYDDATGQFENEAFAYEFDGTSWMQVGTWTSTTPGPSGLAGPTSCG